MAGSKCCTKVTFPVNLSNLNMDEDEFVLDILRELIRIVVLGRLRHVEGQIYEVLVEQSHDGYNFASAGLTNSSITVEFLSSENTSYLLADAVVDEILQLQKEGSSQNDMLAVFGAMDGVNKNLAWWCDEIIGSYQSGQYCGILDDAYEARENMRKNVTMHECRSFKMCISENASVSLQGEIYCIGLNIFTVELVLSLSDLDCAWQISSTLLFPIGDI